jgi:hypothetical protein
MPLTQIDSSMVALPSGTVVGVPTYMCEFSPWSGDPILAPVYNRNSKPVVDLNGTPMFPELAVLRMLEDEGWSGVWIDNFRGRFLNAWSDPPTPVQLSARYAAILGRVPEKKGRWDVFVWCAEDVRFVELKGKWRKGRDRIRDSQCRWLEAALSVGFHVTQFALVEWTMHHEGCPPSKI